MIVVCARGLSPALEPAERGVPRTQMFHPAALSRSNKRMNPTRRKRVL